MPIDWFLPLICLIILLALIFAITVNKQNRWLAIAGIVVLMLGIAWIIYIRPGQVLAKSALIGDVEAQYQLSQWYVHRRIIPDRSQMYYWLNKAADGQHPQAMSDLAGIYMSGDPFLGIKRDVDKALRLYGLAASKGNRDAKAQIERILAGQTSIQEQPGRNGR